MYFSKYQDQIEGYLQYNSGGPVEGTVDENNNLSIGFSISPRTHHEGEATKFEKNAPFEWGC